MAISKEYVDANGNKLVVTYGVTVGGVSITRVALNGTDVEQDGVRLSIVGDEIEVTVKKSVRLDADEMRVYAERLGSLSSFLVDIERDLPAIDRAMTSLLSDAN